MKNFNLLFLATSLFFSAQLFSQTAIQTAMASQPAMNAEWQQTENWLQTFHSTFGKEASSNWMSELSMNGQVYLNTETGGFIIILPKYIDSNAKLQAKFKYGIYENKNTRLMPIMDEVAYSDNLWTTRFLGILGGVPASLDMAVVKQGEKYLTVMGFYPSHELSNDFSQKFQHLVERNYGGKIFASR